LRPVEKRAKTQAKLQVRGGSMGAQAGEIVILEQRGPVAFLVLNRPHANHSLNDEMRSAIMRALEEVRTSAKIQALVITSTGEDAFSAGNDIEEIATMTSLEAEAAAQKSLRMHRMIAALDKPVVAAIKGACLGAGFELALHCDIRLARADARFGFPGVNVGLTSSGSALARLQKISGTGAAAALALTGGMVPAERAFMLGLVSNVANEKDFEVSVQQLAAHLTTLSPVALAEMKKILRAGAEEGLAAAAEQGPKSMAVCYAEGGAADRLRVLFGTPGPTATLH
jgi:enoyl-CoA hydratase/carnithine racemase